MPGGADKKEHTPIVERGAGGASLGARAEQTPGLINRFTRPPTPSSSHTKVRGVVSQAMVWVVGWGDGWVDRGGRSELEERAWLCSLSRPAVPRPRPAPLTHLPLDLPAVPVQKEASAFLYMDHTSG
jgi:hypothetical protein